MSTVREFVTPLVIVQVRRCVCVDENKELRSSESSEREVENKERRRASSESKESK